MKRNFAFALITVLAAALFTGLAVVRNNCADNAMADYKAADTGGTLTLGSTYATDIVRTTQFPRDAGAFETVEDSESSVPPAPQVHLSYYVDPDNGLDRGPNGAYQTEPNGVLHDGQTRAQAWKTVKEAAWLAPDANGVTIYLMEGNHGPCIMQKLGFNRYPHRTHYVTITPDPNNCGKAVFSSERYWNAKRDKHSWSPALMLNDGVVPFWLRFEHCTFTTDTNDTSARSHGAYCYGWEVLVSVNAAHHVQFVDCNIVGILGTAPGDTRPHSTYSTVRLLLLNEVDIGAATPAKTSNVLVQGCTLKNGWFGLYMSITSIGENVQVIGNDISRTSANGMTSISTTANKNGLAGEPYTKWPLWQGNYVHNQVRMWGSNPPGGDNYSGGAAHGTGIAPTSGRVRVVGNIVRCYGNTASIRNYPKTGANPTAMTELYLVNNLVLNPLNYSMELYQLGSGSKILHNTCIGVRRGEVGRYYWGNPWNRYPGSLHIFQNWGSQNNNFDVNDLQICNNIFLGYNGVPPSGCEFTGNVLWSMGRGYSQTTLDALWAGNKLYCASTAVPPAIDNDANSIIFTTEGAFFKGGTLWANAYNGHYIDDANIYRVIGDDSEPGHMFDIVDTADAVNFGSVVHSVRTDFWGSERDTTMPDSGYDEASAAAGEAPELPPGTPRHEDALIREN